MVSQQKQFHKNLRKPNDRPNNRPNNRPNDRPNNRPNNRPIHRPNFVQTLQLAKDKTNLRTRKQQRKPSQQTLKKPCLHLRRKAMAQEETPTQILNQQSTQEPNINATHTIMVVLGCAIDYLQDDRINSALDYAANLDQQVSWFLTGGIKNAIDNTQQTEAARMVIRIHSDQVVLDQTATNTAENFANLRKYVIEQYGHANLPQIVITTSAFHKNRAEKIFNGVFMQNDEIVIHPVWNLGQQACPTCWTDEHIHMKNVDNDVKNALNKYYTFAIKNILQ